MPRAVRERVLARARVARLPGLATHEVQDEDVLDAERLSELFLDALALSDLGRFEEAKSLIRKTMPVARRVLGESDQLVLGMRQNFALTLYQDPAATLDDLREAVTTLEDTARIARRVLGGSHPLVAQIEVGLRDARAALCAHGQT